MDKSDAATRILIADDHTIFRAGLRKLLELEPDFRVVGEAANGQEAIKLAADLRPDILLLELLIPGFVGLEVLRRLKASSEKVRTLVLTALDNKNEIAEAFRLGARGVVLKDSATEVLIRSIRSVMEDKYWVGRESAADLAAALRGLAGSSAPAGNSRTFRLTKRELAVVSAIVSGYSNKEIAHKYTISEDTVKHHLTNIFDKIGVYNRLELALFAIHHGLVGGEK